MNKLELEHTRVFLRGSEKEKQALFLEYLEKFDDTVNFKKTHYRRFLCEEEVDSNAIFAIEEMFKEVESILIKSEMEVDKQAEKHKASVRSRISLSTIFNKHLTREARDNKLENQPLTQTIKLEFGKTTKKSCYKGYEYTFPVDTEDILVDEDFPGSPQQERLKHIESVINAIAPDIGSDIHTDLIEYFIEGMTYQAIADSTRNKGVSKQAISDRIKRYIKKIKKRLNQEDKYGVE